MFEHRVMCGHVQYFIYDYVHCIVLIAMFLPVVVYVGTTYVLGNLDHILDW